MTHATPLSRLAGIVTATVAAAIQPRFAQPKKTQSPDIRPQVCAQLRRLVDEARLQCSEIVERREEDPSFTGSVEEADLIYNYIDHHEPGLGVVFVYWCAGRQPLEGASPSGVDIYTARREFNVRGCDVGESALVPTFA